FPYTTLFRSMSQIGDLRQDNSVHARIQCMLDDYPISRRDAGIDDKAELPAGEGKLIGRLLGNDPMLHIEDDDLVSQQGGDFAGRQIGVFQPECQSRALLAAAQCGVRSFAGAYHCEPMAIVMSCPSIPKASVRQ